MRRSVLAVVVLLLVLPLNANSFTTSDGAIIFTPAATKLEALGVEILDATQPTYAGPAAPALSYQTGVSRTAFITRTGTTVGTFEGTLRYTGALVLSHQANVMRLRDFVVVARIAGGQRDLFVANGTAADPISEALFTASAQGWSVTSSPETLLLPNTPLLLTPYGATVLGLAADAPRDIGSIAMRMELLSGKVTTAAGVHRPLVPPAPTATPVGADLTFCSLDNFTHVGQAGAVAAFTAGTTSWNIGTQLLDWWAPPDDWRHPFIVLNMYRIRDGVFEQLGGSWVKHGFYAASRKMCGDCDDRIQGRQLPVGCTDTYDHWTNADQSWLGPRHEINPWTGFWTRTLASGWRAHLLDEHTHHDMTEHLLKVNDDDLDPAKNAGARYFVEGFYVHYQDVNVMNSAAWKPVTYSSGQPGELAPWEFVMADEQTPPQIGFAIDAWDPDLRSTVAQTLPVVKSMSPDGRAVLAVKTTDLGGGRWRYVYVLFNIDMARQIGGLALPIPPGVTVTDPYFHGVTNTEEKVNAPGGIAIDDAPWTFEQTDGVVRWQTTSNPLRWGTTYTFAFTADKPPGDAEATVHLFTAGSTNEIRGATRVPSP